MNFLPLTEEKKIKTKWIIGLIAAILFIIFLLQNTQVVTLRLYFWSISMSQIILIPLILVLGFVVGYVVAKLTSKHARERKTQGNETGEFRNSSIR